MRRRNGANVDFTEAGQDEDEDEQIDLETTVNPFILTTADETVAVRQIRFILDSDHGSTKFPDKAFSTDSLSDGSKDGDDLRTPVASSRYVRKTSTPGVHFARAIQNTGTTIINLVELNSRDSVVQGDCINLETYAQQMREKHAAPSSNEMSLVRTTTR